MIKYWDDEVGWGWQEEGGVRREEGKVLVWEKPPFAICPFQILVKRSPVLVLPRFNFDFSESPSESSIGFIFHNFPESSDSSGVGISSLGFVNMKYFSGAHMSWNKLLRTSYPVCEVTVYIEPAVLFYPVYLTWLQIRLMIFGILVS